MTAYDKTMKEMLERIEELEQLSARVGHGWADEIRSRVSSLETNQGAAFTASKMTLEKHAERQRQARWHATRDAALQGYVHAGVTAEYSRDDVLRWATEFADRAHGPLEGKAQTWMKTPHGVCNHEGIGLPGCELCDPRTRDVDALVKAAEARLDDDHPLSIREREHALMDALKPFRRPTLPGGSYDANGGEPEGP